MGLRLLFRYELGFSEQIEYDLSGRVPESLIGYISGRTNPEPGPVGDWLKSLGMPYRALYIPIFVYNGVRPIALSDESTGGWGQEFYLDPESVLPDLKLICQADIQDAAFDKRPVSWFTDLRDLTIEQKTAALVEASRKSGRYAEARMFRSLRLEDFLPRE